MDSLDDIDRQQQEISNNLSILQEGILKSQRGEFKTALELHKWVYSHGYKVELGEKIRDLHLAEQIDADEQYKKKEKND